MDTPFAPLCQRRKSRFDSNPFCTWLNETIIEYLVYRYDCKYPISHGSWSKIRLNWNIWNENCWSNETKKSKREYMQGRFHTRYRPLSLYQLQIASHLFLNIKHAYPITCIFSIRQQTLLILCWQLHFYKTQKEEHRQKLICQIIET